jgi:regulator of sigma E protease
MTVMSVIESLRTPAAFLFVLGVLVFVHEFGHFLVARWHGVRVITFSLGFGPKLLKFQRGDTEYCVSAVPLGGYVKLAGETVEEDRTGAPDEFLSKSKWVRFQVYLAGPIMNLLLAWLVLAGVLSRGADVRLYESAPPVIGSIVPGTAAERAGFQAGDRVVSVAGRDVLTWDALTMEILPKANQPLDIVVDRHGQRVTVRVTPSSVGRYEVGVLGINPVMRPEIYLVTPGSPADRAGIKRGDVILAIDGLSGLQKEAIYDRIHHAGGQRLTFTLEREGQRIDASVIPEESGGVGLIGLGVNEYEFRRVDPTLLQALSISAEQNWESTVLIGRTLKGLFKRETPVKTLMGPISIASMAGTAAQLGWLSLFNLMSMISLNLGLLNLMPVPVLDGGHIAILGVEGLARRDLSIKVKERILMVGAALIMLLMVTVIYNDVLRLFR